MPPEHEAPGSPSDWLRRARSDLALARMPLPPGVVPEDLCFHAQQAAQKALKAVLVAASISVPRTHSLRLLLDTMPDDRPVPAEVEEAAILTDHAVAGRYPGAFEPLTDADRREAVRLADSVVAWAGRVLGPGPGGGA